MTISEQKKTILRAFIAHAAFGKNDNTSDGKKVLLGLHVPTGKTFVRAWRGEEAGYCCFPAPEFEWSFDDEPPFPLGECDFYLLPTKEEAEAICCKMPPLLGTVAPVSKERVGIFDRIASRGLAALSYQERRALVAILEKETPPLKNDPQAGQICVYRDDPCVVIAADGVCVSLLCDEGESGVDNYCLLIKDVEEENCVFSPLVFSAQTASLFAPASGFTVADLLSFVIG